MNNETATLLEKHFDLAFAGPKGVQKLRELILTLAMQGKLVPQDPTDRPASELLKDIESEKVRLIKEGKIRQLKPLPEIKLEEIPYDLPNGCEWKRLGDIFELKSGYSFAKEDEANIGKYMYLKVGEMNLIGNETIISTTSLFLNDSPKVVNALIPENSIIFPKRGGAIATNKKRLVMEPICVDTNIMSIRCPNQIDLSFAYHWILSIDLATLNTGTSVPQINNKDIEPLLFPVMPLAEQHRIVAKIEQLMARCDELETLGTDRTQKRTNVHRAAIDRLLTAKADLDFNTAWNFITQHFGELYSVKENVTELRKAILQLAIMGKLVPQDPTDEPASELLKDIELEKQKLKKHKPLQTIKPEEIPYTLPSEWQWVRLEEITQIKGGKRVSNGYKLLKTPTPYIYIRVSDMKHGAIDNSDLHYIDEEMHAKIKQYTIFKEDIYMTIVGATIGKCGIIPEKFDGMHLTENAARIILYKSVDKFYLLKCLQSLLCQEQFTDKTKQVGVQKMALNKLSSTIIPLPPTSEQHRIVAKVDRLMELCDRLDEQIEAAKTKQTELLNALMAEV